MLKPKAIQHVGLIVPDVEEAGRWYAETAGFVRSGEFFTGGGVHAVFVTQPDLGLMYELIQHPEGSDTQRRAQRCGGWMDHMAFEVADIEAEFAKAQEMGLLVIEGIVQVPEFWQNGFEYFLLRAPGGEKVEYCRVK